LLCEDGIFSLFIHSWCKFMYYTGGSLISSLHDVASGCE
jgi:hypothetical protein